GSHGTADHAQMVPGLVHLPGES
ncbi:hypothetical protein PANDA_019680, partial [Ailuropoda melanoleuca]